MLSESYNSDIKEREDKRNPANNTPSAWRNPSVHSSICKLKMVIIGTSYTTHSVES